jgi:hypothetical protein
MLAHRRVGQDRTALRAKGFRESEREHDVRVIGDAELRSHALTAISNDPQGMCFVDDEDGAVGTAYLDEVGQGSSVAEDGVDRLDDDHRPPLGPPAEQLAHMGDVVVSRDGDGSAR